MFGEYPVGEIINTLQDDDLLPAILFRTARKQCDADVDKASRARSLILSASEQRALEAEVDAVIAKYGFERDFITSYPQYQALVTTGVGAHHAGQLLIWRLLLEELMTRGKLRLMVATGTVAAGVDFPARTVVITAHSRRGSEGFSDLTASELQQMAGRAGRRGKDKVGLCLVAPGQFADARVIREVSKRPPEPLRSSYFASPSTVLNLLKYRNVDDLQYTVSRSLAVFLDRKNARKMREDAIRQQEGLEDGKPLTREAHKKAEKRVRRVLREAEDLEMRQENLLKVSLEGLAKLGHLEGGALTEKGYWAAELCTGLILELAECVADGLFEQCQLFELVGLVAALAGDPHRPYFRLKHNPVPKEKFTKLGEIISRVRAAYLGPLNTEVDVLHDAALTVITWMECETWAEFSGLLRLSGVADGDVARLVSQTADHLNQLVRLHKTHPALADMAKVGRARLLRPPFAEHLIVEA